jgi:hypothetical protein
MESICTAETAEDAEIALLRPSAISAVSAVPPAFGPRILRKKMPGIFMGRSRVSSLSRSMTPHRRTSHHSQRADRACDSGRRVSTPPSRLIRGIGLCATPAWLTAERWAHENRVRLEHTPAITHAEARRPRRGYRVSEYAQHPQPLLTRRRGDREGYRASEYAERRKRHYSRGGAETAAGSGIAPRTPRLRVIPGFEFSRFRRKSFPRLSTVRSRNSSPP